MVQPAVSEITTYSWSFEEDIQNYLECGVQAVGVWRDKLSDFGVEKGAELLADSGVRASSLQWAGGFTGSDGRSFQESLSDAREAILAAQAIGAPCLIIYGGGRAGHTRRHAGRLFQTALEQLLPDAESSRVTLAVEPMHPGCAADFTTLTTIDETIRLLSQFSSPRLQMAFDTYHLGECLADEVMETLAPRIALVQIGDARQPPVGEQNRCALGVGQLPLVEMLASLRRHGYSGDYEIELIGEDLETSDYRRLLEDSLAAFGELARRAGL